jgi:hypothetical protein
MPCKNMYNKGGASFGCVKDYKHPTETLQELEQKCDINSDPSCSQCYTEGPVVLWDDYHESLNKKKNSGTPLTTWDEYLLERWIEENK